jgi:hypothetical protein
VAKVPPALNKTIKTDAMSENILRAISPLLSTVRNDIIKWGFESGKLQ